MLIVQKFGGSSLADAERLRRAAQICLEARQGGHSTVVVVSAMGDTTDDLTQLARQINPRPPLRELDALMATGEQQSAALMAIMLESMGCAARSFSGAQAGIITNERHGSAPIAFIAPERLEAALEAGYAAVVSGFQGISPAGDITTLGRGGSDTTAVALAAALKADRCEIYTDVDGIYTADPRLVTGARLLREIDYTDMLRLSQAGSQVLHPESVRLAMANGVEIRLLSSFERGEGSVVRRLTEEKRPDFAGVTRDSERSILSAVGRAAGAETLSALVLLLSRAGIPVLSGQAGEGSVSLKLSPAHVLPALELVHSALIGRG